MTNIRNTGARQLSARSIALSVLLGTHPPVLPGRSLTRLNELFGIPAGTTRTALSRLVAVGDLAISDGRYRLTERLLARQASQDIGRRSPAGRWNDDWHTIVTADDQRDLAERRRFRSAMANHRFGELRPDIWMRPANLSAPPPDPGWLAITGPLAGRSPAAVVRQLWNLDAIAVEARTLIDRLAEHVGAADANSIPDLFTMSAAVVRFLRADPLLPTELLPADWPLPELRARYDDAERELQSLLRSFLRR